MTGVKAGVTGARQTAKLLMRNSRAALAGGREEGILVTVSMDERHAITSGLLKQFWLFDGLAGPDVERIARVASFRSVERGDVIFDYNDVARSVYCVLSGLVKLMVRTGRRKERIFELVEAGQSFGEGVAFVGQPTRGRAVAVQEGRLLTIPSRALVEMLGSSPALALRLVYKVSQRVSRLLAELESDAAQSSSQRIVSWLVAQLRKQPGETRIHLDISKATLAASLNTTPETFSRVLRHLRESGVIRVEGRDIVVCDPSRLKSLRPCLYCRKTDSVPAAGCGKEDSVDWEALLASGTGCDVQHWFHDCNCEVPHWCSKPPGGE